MLVQESQEVFTLAEAIFVWSDKWFQFITAAKVTAVYEKIPDISGFFCIDFSFCCNIWSS